MLNRFFGLLRDPVSASALSLAAAEGQFYPTEHRCEMVRVDENGVKLGRALIVQPSGRSRRPTENFHPPVRGVVTATSAMEFLVLHGPRFNLFGRRSRIYGTTTLAEINERLHRLADERGVALETLRSNHEACWSTSCEESMRSTALLNPAALTQRSAPRRDQGDAFPGARDPATNIAPQPGAIIRSSRRRSRRPSRGSAGAPTPPAWTPSSAS